MWWWMFNFVFSLYQWTPLHRAVEYRVPDLVRCLVDRGADVDIKDYRGGVSNVYSDDRYNQTHLHRTYKLPEVGGAFRR